MGVSNILELLGGVALFLFGMALMGDSLKKVAGNKLELILFRLSSTPLKGILLGTGVTAVIQSSSATSVMVVGFVNSGMMKVRQAIGVVMGAIIGTSITGWIICLSDLGGGASGWLELLSTDTLTAVIAVIGIILRMFSGSSTKKHVGEILLGFAVLMFGMKAMSGSVYELRSSEVFINMLTTFSNPLLGILLGLIFTSVIQSASAAVGILQALAITGAIRFDIALPIIMGIAIGAAVPVLLSALGASADGKRTALSYLLVDTLGVIVFSAIFYALNAVISFSFMSMAMSAVSLALLNTVFRFVIVILLAPFIPQLEKLGCLIIRDKASGGEELQDFERLEERFLNHPALAVEQSRLTVNAMAKKSKENLFGAFALIDAYSDEGFDRVNRLEDIVDKYEDKLGTYLIHITSRELNPEQNGAVGKYLHAINDFERISDHALNIAECAKELHDKEITFSSKGEKELNVLICAVSEIVGTAVSAFVDNDIERAYRVEPLEELIDNLCDEMKMHHIDRLQKGICTLHHGFVFNDLLTNLERVSDHCSNIAVAMIELESESFDAHEYINSLIEVRSHCFDEYYEEYSKKYVL
ncbi:MAG: Na/Pi cotransporter family protein [Oscillospiraceae bacterium]|nr:Na/Pi cotransporter family protein [Oscillospiraceae bacterium]